MPPRRENNTKDGQRDRLDVDLRRERIIDFAFGNAALENPRITREMIRRAYERIHAIDGGRK